MVILTHQIHIASDISPYPDAAEVSAGVIIANYLQADVMFIKSNSYAKTPDFKIGNDIWELKSPIGNSKNTMKNNLRNADNQSPNVILDLRRSKMHAKQALNRIKYELARATKIKRLLVITKSGRILELR